MVIYLVTGTTRGIGFELVRQLARDARNQIIAGVRDISSPASKKVAQLGSRVMVVQIDSCSDTDPKAAAEFVVSKGIHHIDVIIANAGKGSDCTSLVEITPQDFHETMTVNALSPLLVFQSFLPLLSRSKAPKFVIITSAIGSFALQRLLSYKNTSYGTSKVAANFLTLRIAIEHPTITSFAIRPGIVNTEMGIFALAKIGSSMATALDDGTAISAEQAAGDIIDVVREATLETHSGRFFNTQIGPELPYELPW